MSLKDRINKAAEVAAKKREMPILMGEFLAVCESVKAKTYKTGAFGFEFVFTLTGAGDTKGRKVFENLIMNKASGEALEYSADKLLRRLYALGVGDAEIEKGFNVPENSDETGDLPSLSGTQVILKLEQEIRKDTGEASQRIKSVRRLEAKTKAA